MTDQSTTTHDHAPERSPDVQLAARRDLALAALRAIVPADQIGEGHRVRAEGELVVTHFFPATKRGYRGWEWYVTLARVPGSEQATVCESGMLPGDDALLAPEWVPWAERMLDSDHEDADHEDAEHGDHDHGDGVRDGAEHAGPEHGASHSDDSEEQDPDQEADEAERGERPEGAAEIDPAP